MKYIIALKTAVLREGLKPASARVTDGYVVLNENELRYRHPDKTLEESAGAVDGIIVSRQTAIDFLSTTKTLEQIKSETGL